MATLGRYEILRTLADDGMVAVHAARSASRPDAPLIRLVTFRPSAALVGHPRNTIERIAFVDAFKRQQQLAQSSESWARITEIGRDGETTMVVVDHPPASLDDVVIGRVALEANTLRHLVTEIVRALRATIKADQRPHGALAPSTVLIEPGKPLAETTIRLTDPAPPLHDESLDPHAEMRRLGLLILRLVDPQPTWSGVRWPIQSSPAWKRIGRSGEAWRELVNRLLDPNAEQRGTGLSLEQVEDSLPVEPRDLRKPLGLATAAAILAIGGGAIYWNFFYVPALTDAQVDPARIALTNLYWEHWWWFTAFHAPISQPNQDPFAAHRQSAEAAPAVRYLDEQIVQPLRTATAETRGLYFKPGPYFDDQRNYANISASQIASLGFEDLKSNIDQPELGRIENALELIGTVRSALQKWPLRERLANAAAEFESRGWNGAGREARQIAQAALSPPNPAEVGAAHAEVEQRDVLAAANAVLEAAPALTQIEAILAAQQRIEERAAAIGLTVPQALGDWLNDHVGGAASLAELQSDLAAVEPIVREIDAILAEPEGIYAWAIFDEEVGLAPAVPATADAAYFSAWAETAKQYRAMRDDPRGPIRANLDPWTLAVTGTIERIAGFTNQRANELTEKRQQLTANVRSLLDRSAIEKNREEIARQVTTLSDSMSALQREADDLWRSLNRPAGAYLTDMRATSFGSPALDALWQRRLSAAGLEQRLVNDPAVYGAFYQQTDGIQRAFTAVMDERFPRPRSLPEATPGWQPGALDQVILRELEARRALVGEAIVAAAEAQPNSVVALTTPSVAESLAQQESAFTAWFNRVASFADDMVRMEDQFEIGAMPDESIGGAPTPRAIRAQWFNGEHAALATELRPAAQQILARLDAAEAVLNAADASTLLTQLGTTTPDEYPSRWWAAWRRLGELPFGNNHTLATERQLLDALRDWLGSEELPESRRAQMADRLTTAAAERWLTFAGSLSDPAAFESAFAERTHFAVDDASLPDWLRWNLELSDLRAALRPLGEDGSRDPQAKDLLRRFLVEAQRDAGPANARSEAAKLREEIDIIVNDREETVDFTKIGPATIDRERWYFDADVSDPIGGERPPERIVYRMRKKQRSDPDDLTIEFVLLHKSEFPQHLAGSIYVSVNEVSFDLFWQTVRDPAIWSAVDGHLDTTARGSTDGRPGPRVWTRSPNGNLLTQPQHWLVYDPARDPEQKGALADRTYPAGQTPAPPNGSHPMQYVSPQAAFFVARRLGCRLPTSEEMRAAGAKAFGGDGLSGAADRIRAGSPTAPTPNLRDETFATQTAHARDYRAAQNNRPGVFTPEAGAFRAQAREMDVYPINDGTLWFHEVMTGDTRPVRHVLGNVAEWVYDRPEDIIGEDPLAVPAPTDILNRMVGDHLGIMGGSALSAPSLRPDEKLTLDLGAFMIDERKGFADVGFRLVLVPGRLTTIAQYILQKSDQAYLTAAPPLGGEP